MNIDIFNERYINNTLTFEDLMWYLSLLKEECSTFDFIGNSFTKDNIRLFFMKEDSMTSCHIETLDKVIRFEFFRQRNGRDEYFNPIRIRKGSKGYKKFLKYEIL